MTTRKFSTTALPYPRYSLEVGSFELGPQDEDAKLPRMVPTFCDIAQLVEVKSPSMKLTQKGSPLESLSRSCILIEHASPELFLRRDFITNFVLTGTVYLWHDSGLRYSSKLPKYKISCTKNVLNFLMDEHQYARFGLIGKRVNKKKGKRLKTLYQVEVDLRDDKILESNKYQDRLMAAFKRLSNISKLYFRWAPDDTRDLTEETINKTGVDFFNSIVSEYNKFGFSPLPLTGCSEICQKLERKWTNRSQLYPGDESNRLLASCFSDPIEGIERDEGKLSALVDLVDWLGHQLLLLNCDSEFTNMIGSGRSGERVDVTCSQLSGPMDFDLIQCGLHKIFGKTTDEDIILRALILYDHQASGWNQNMDELAKTSGGFNYSHGPANSGVVLLQQLHSESTGEQPPVPEAEPARDRKKRAKKAKTNDDDDEEKTRIITIKLS